MYRVNYAKLALMKNGTTGNISQGDDVAYMNCSLGLVEKRLEMYLSHDNRKKKYVPVIRSVERIPGHLVLNKE